MDQIEQSTIVGFQVMYDDINDVIICIGNDNIILPSGTIADNIIATFGNITLDIDFIDMNGFNSTNVIPGQGETDSVQTRIKNMLMDFLSTLNIPNSRTFKVKLTFQDLGNSGVLAYTVRHLLTENPPTSINNNLPNIPSSMTTYDVATKSNITVIPNASATQYKIWNDFGTTFDPIIEMVININSNYWNTNFYDFSNNYTNNSSKFSFKTTIIHELIHSFGFVNAITSDSSQNKYITVFGSYVFQKGNEPLNSTDFISSSFDRLSSSGTGDATTVGINNVIFTNGEGFEVDIHEQSMSHLKPNNSNNGIMESFALRNGSAPSVNDYTILSLLGWNNNFGICIYPGAQVLTPTGYKNVEDVKKGDIVIDDNDNDIIIINNLQIAYKSETKCFHFKKNCFGDNKPDKDIILTHGHPIKVNKEDPEKPCQNFIDNENIFQTMDKPKFTYSLCTEKRVPIKMNNIYVWTWGNQDFKEFYKQALAQGYNILFERL